MYNTTKPLPTTLKRNKSYEGERIEQKIQRIMNNKEPITDGAPIIFTERKDGVQPEYNIKTDRFEIAVEAHDVIAKHHIARREEKIKEFTKELEEKNKSLDEKNKNQNGGAESAQTTGNQ